LKHNRGRWLLFGITILVASLAPGSRVSAEEAAQTPGPDGLVAFASENLSPGSISSGLEVAIVVLAVTLVPVLVLMTTSFIRMVVVLALVRHGLGSQHLPPTSVLVGLSLLLTIVVMTPVWEEVYARGLEPLLRKECTPAEALARGLEPVRAFLLRNVRPSDLTLFADLNQVPADLAAEEMPTRLLVPSFVISELGVAFQMGFRILLPFLIIDMVVASALVSMGVFMLPPAMVSLPFKLLLFVLADGWQLVVGALLKSYG
jgi:flagellar biosynthetic protein FliP